MDDLGNIKLMLNDPFKGRGEQVKKEGGTAQAEGEDHIEKIKALPFHSQEFPVCRVDGDIPKGCFDV